MVLLNDVEHLPIAQKIPGEKDWYRPVEIAEIERLLKDEAGQFKEGKRQLAYVAGRIEKESKHYLIFSYVYHSFVQGIFSEKPRALDDIALYKKIASME